MPDIESEWVEWMQNVHIPEVIETGCFKEARFLKLTNPLQPREQGIMYAVQYAYSKSEDFETYSHKYGPGLREKTRKLFGEEVLTFRTHLEILSQF